MVWAGGPGGEPEPASTENPLSVAPGFLVNSPPMKLVSLSLSALALVIAGCGTPEGQVPEGNGGTTPEILAHPGGQTPTTLPPMAMQPFSMAGPITTQFTVSRDPVLMSGDAILISVYNEPDLSLSVRLSDLGSFTFPLIGVVEAVGTTPGQLESVIRDRLAKDYIHNPQVTVTVLTYAPRQVFILGGVVRPSGYSLPPSERITLLSLISTAGGITDKAYKEYVQIVRKDPKGKREVLQVSLVDIESAIARGMAEADIELQPDDLVVIPSAARVVYVLGSVKAPGWFEIPADTRMTASMAISRAGSYTKFASTGSIQVLRQVPGSSPKSIPVNLDDVLSGNLQADIVLQPGDVVWVPERGIF